MNAPAAASRVDEILRAACRVVVTGRRERSAHRHRRAGGGRVAHARPLLLHDATGAASRGVRVRRGPPDRSARASSSRRSRPEPSAPSARSLRTIEPELEETPALWNEVWSSLRYDEELRPLVQERYRAWADRIVRLLEEGREDGSVPSVGEPGRSRLAARCGGRRARLDPLSRPARPRRGRACCSPRASSASSTR